MAQQTPRRDLIPFAWLSIGAAVLTISLKTLAWWMTGSVGLLSDAAESVVNLVAAIVALVALKVAARPHDVRHHFGHTKAEYFSAAIEGIMIFVAAAAILYTSVDRFLHPQPLENVGWGLAVSTAASVVNGAVAFVLLRAGRTYHSITLSADGRHLLTDVWTSAGVLVGVLLVWVSALIWPPNGIERLDPVIAFIVGLNIIVTGWRLISESAGGLMDLSLPDSDHRDIVAVLQSFATDEVRFHGLRTRASGHNRFAMLHMLVPGTWTVNQGHDLLQQVEDKLLAEIPDLDLMIHLEPIEDPRSYDDHPIEIPVDDEIS